MLFYVPRRASGCGGREASLRVFVGKLGRGGAGTRFRRLAQDDGQGAHPGPGPVVVFFVVGCSLASRVFRLSRVSFSYIYMLYIEKLEGHFFLFFS